MKNIFIKIKSKVNKKLLTYIVFIFIAVVIWYLNALSKDYTDSLKFKVKYAELPDDQVLAQAPPRHIFLTINAQGFTLLKYRFGFLFSPLTIEASYSTMRKKNASMQGEYFLVTQSIFNRIASQLGSNVHLSNISPDTLFFHFSETAQKEIPVKPLVQLQLEKGFLPKGEIQVTPPSITVTGPKSIIDTMQYVFTQTKLFKKLKDNLRSSIELKPVERLRFSVNEVEIAQAVERHTEATITATIDPINVPEGLAMKVFPSTVTINCLVPIADYDKLQPYLFRAVVDYISVKDAVDDQTKVKVEISRTPDYVADVKFFPASVDFIIEK